MISNFYSLWVNVVVLVRKRDGSFYFCVDYRKLNVRIVREFYKFFVKFDVFDCLFGVDFFFIIDFKSGYW